MGEKEINLEFGARHEDAAIEAYQKRIGHEVYGTQCRIKVAMPCGGAAVALASAFPPTDSACKAQIDSFADGFAMGQIEPYFYLTGFTDGIVDVPRVELEKRGPVADREVVAKMEPPETLVVEVKHRMGKIQ